MEQITIAGHPDPIPTSEDEPPPTGLGTVFADLKDKAAQRGYGNRIG